MKSKKQLFPWLPHFIEQVVGKGNEGRESEEERERERDSCTFGLSVVRGAVRWRELGEEPKNRKKRRLGSSPRAEVKGRATRWATTTRGGASNCPQPFLPDTLTRRPLLAPHVSLSPETWERETGPTGPSLL